MTQHWPPQLKKEKGLIAEHFMVAIPRGIGLHIYLIEENPTKRTRILISQDGQHLGEIRRAGSYVVGPGSQIAGRPYEALTNNAPVKVEDAEEWTAELLESFGVSLRKAPPQAAQHERGPIDIEGVDADGSLALALKVLHPERANWLCALLQEPKVPTRYSSPSEADYDAVSALIEAGMSDQEVAAIWIQSPLGQRSKVQGRSEYVALTVANARAAAEVRKTGIATSARPILAAQEGEADSVVGEAIKAGQMGVEVDLLRAVNQTPRLIDQLHEFEERLAGIGVALDPGTVQSLIAERQKGPFMISAAPGIGKTHQVVQLAEEHDMVVNRPVLHAVPSHKSFANVERHGYWEHWQGHANGEDGGEPCPSSVLGNKGYRPGRDCTCGWIRPADDGGHVPTVSPVEYLLADTPDGRPPRPEALSQDRQLGLPVFETNAGPVTKPNSNRYMRTGLLV